MPPPAPLRQLSLPPAIPLPTPPPLPLTHKVMQAVSAVDEAQVSLAQAQQRLEHAAAIATGSAPDIRCFHVTDAGPSLYKATLFAAVVAYTIRQYQFLLLPAHDYRLTQALATKGSLRPPSSLTPKRHPDGARLSTFPQYLKAL